MRSRCFRRGRRMAAGIPAGSSSRRPRVVAEQRAHDRNVAEQRHLVAAVGRRSSIRPPSTTICVSSTITVDSSARLTVMMPPCAAVSVFDARHLLVDRQPDRAAFGDLRLHAQHASPMSLALERLERLTVASPPVVAYWPVMSGMFWPTMIRASSLSSVSSVGVDRMLAPACVSSARARNARLVIVADARNGDRAADHAERSGPARARPGSWRRR